MQVAITSATGTFTATMSVAGPYTLKVRRLGYIELTTTPVPLRVGDTVIVAIDLMPTSRSRSIRCTPRIALTAIS